MTAPTDLSILPVVSRCSSASAPGPLTSSRFSGVMSYIATAVRVFQASAAAMGEWNIAAHASRAGGCHSAGSPSTSSALASNQCGRSQPALSRNTAPSSFWRAWNGLTRRSRGDSLGCSGCRTS